MRALLAIHNSYTDNASGAARCMRILMEWLAAAGHEARVLSTARCDVPPRLGFEDHLASLGAPLRRLPPCAAFARWVRARRGVGGGRPVFGFELGGVEVEAIATEHNVLSKPNRLEYEQFVLEFDRVFDAFRPDVVLAYGASAQVQEALRRARAGGAATLFSLHNHGYEDPGYYRHADHVLTAGEYLRRLYAEALGLRSTALPPPIAWSEAASETDARAFVTFVNPALHKGAAPFGRLADMLGRARPDIPILVVQSAADATLLNSAPGIDFSRYPQIMAAPPTPRPRDFFALTKLLLVPSVFEEPFGTVAAEAMINGVPALVSQRGGLPETVQEGGLALPLPDWLKPDTARLPSEADMQPWFDAICRLWDDPQAYSAAAQRAREVGERLYDEATLRRRYLDYLEGLRPGGNPLPAASARHARPPRGR